jgi:voltage-gated potassium channel
LAVRSLLFYYLWKARKRKSLGFTLVTAALVLSVVGNAVTFLIFDGAENPDLGFFDCLWLSVISISTIGYGDLSASSPGARAGTVIFIIIIGLAAFTTFFGMVLDWFIGLKSREQKGMCRVYEKGHILIVNFPSRQRVRQVIEELAHDEKKRKKGIVIVTDQISELPFDEHNVSFVYGSPVEEETYHKANIAEAEEAIVLCTGPDDPNSDSVVASIVLILEHIKPGLYTVAECLNAKHKGLFESSSCDAIVYSTRIINNLLVHESLDKGVIRLVNEITTHQVGDTLYTLEVGAMDDPGIDCIHLAKVLLDHSVNLQCILRGDETFTNFTGLEVRPEDVMVYISQKRLTWDEIRKMIR